MWSRATYETELNSAVAESVPSWSWWPCSWADVPRRRWSGQTWLSWHRRSSGGTSHSSPPSLGTRGCAWIPVAANTPHKPAWDWHRGTNVLTSLPVGQRSSPLPRNSVKVEIKFHLECKLCFSSAQSMLRKIDRNNLSVNIEAKYCVSWLRFDV